MSGKFPPPTHDTPWAQMERMLRPGRGCCGRCGMPWGTVEEHTTWYDGHPGHRRGCFPLCEGCWILLGHPEARIEYYAAMIDVWAQDGYDVEEDRRAIGRAVAAGG